MIKNNHHPAWGQWLGSHRIGGNRRQQVVFGSPQHAMACTEIWVCIRTINKQVGPLLVAPNCHPDEEACKKSPESYWAQKFLATDLRSSSLSRHSCIQSRNSPTSLHGPVSLLRFSEGGTFGVCSCWSWNPVSWGCQACKLLLASHCGPKISMEVLLQT